MVEDGWSSSSRLGMRLFSLYPGFGSHFRSRSWRTAACFGLDVSCSQWRIFRSRTSWLVENS
jgi:hypothetical protein